MEKERESNRSHYEIIKDLLEALPGKKTYIRFKARVAYTYFSEYLSLIVERGMADLIHDKYFISPKGKDYLATFNQILVLQN